MRSLPLLITLLAAWFASGSALGQNSTAEPPVADMGMARQWCDQALLQRIEGVWEFPSDRTRVLIRRSAKDPRQYDLIAVETPDVRIMPGTSLGSMRETPDPVKFELSLHRDLRDAIKGVAGSCLATLSASGDAITVCAPEWKFKFNPRWFLPGFWRAIVISRNKAGISIPAGMLKVYPKPITRSIDYL